MSIKKKQEINEQIASLYEQYGEGFETLKEARKSDIEGIDVNDGKASDKFIASLREKLETVARGVVGGVSKFSSSYKIILTPDGGIDRIEYTIKSPIRAKVPYSYTEYIDGKSDIFDEMAKTFAVGLVGLYQVNTAHENIEALNEALTEIFDAEDIKARFKFAVSDKYVTEITNECVTFGVSIENAFNVSGLEIFRSGNEWEDCCRAEEIGRIISAVKSADTTVKLIKANIDIVKAMIGHKSMKRADSIIRKAYSKKAQYIPDKGGVGYFEADIKVDGEDVSIFALVGKDADGNMSVVLNPFNISTLFNIEYDVLANIPKTK